MFCHQIRAHVPASFQVLAHMAEYDATWKPPPPREIADEIPLTESPLFAGLSVVFVFAFLFTLAFFLHKRQKWYNAHPEEVDQFKTCVKAIFMCTLVHGPGFPDFTISFCRRILLAFFKIERLANIIN